MNIYSKFHGNPFNNCWAISFWTKVLDTPTDGHCHPQSHTASGTKNVNRNVRGWRKSVFLNSVTHILSCRAQIPYKLISVDVVSDVKLNVRFNKVQWSGMLHISCQWDSCVVVTACELRSPSMSDFLEGLESSGWLKHIKAVLDAGIFIAKVSLEVNPCCLPHNGTQY